MGVWGDLFSRFLEMMYCGVRCAVDVEGELDGDMMCKWK